jgi:hypothetical protein
MLHGIVGYLIGLAVGYWVLTHADKQKGFIKTVGQVAAWAIMVISLSGALCIGYCRVICPADPAKCGYMSGFPGKGPMKGCHEWTVDKGQAN